MLGCTYPVLSTARLISNAGPPSQFQPILKRVRHLSMIGSSSIASRQFFPPSKETSTARIFPAPDHARPDTSWNPRAFSWCPPDGDVMTDLHSITMLD